MTCTLQLQLKGKLHRCAPEPAGIPAPLLKERYQVHCAPGDAVGQSGRESSIQQGGKGIQRGEAHDPRTHSYRVAMAGLEGLPPCHPLSQ